MPFDDLMVTHRAARTSTSERQIVIVGLNDV